MKTPIKLVSLLIVVIIGTGTIAGCNSSMFKHTPEKKAQWIVNEITDELTLSDAQIQKLNVIKDHVLSLRKEHQSEHESTHQVILGLLSQPTLDQAKLNELVVQKSEMIVSKAPHIITLLGDFYDSLSTEQQKTFREAIAEHMNKRKHQH